MGETPGRRTIHPRPLKHQGGVPLGATNQTTDTTSGTSRSETKTTTSTEERRPDRSSLMWSRSILSPWYIYKQDLMTLKLQTVRFAADAMGMLNDARMSVN